MVGLDGTRHSELCGGLVEEADHGGVLADEAHEPVAAVAQVVLHVHHRKVVVVALAQILHHRDHLLAHLTHLALREIFSRGHLLFDGRELAQKCMRVAWVAREVAAEIGGHSDQQLELFAQKRGFLHHLFVLELGPRAAALVTHRGRRRVGNDLALARRSRRGRGQDVQDGRGGSHCLGRRNGRGRSGSEARREQRMRPS